MSAPRAGLNLGAVPTSTATRRFAALLLLLTLGSARAEARRPFVVEEAELVGKKLVGLDTWLVASREVFAHAALVGIGAGDHVEVKLGAVHGGAFGQGFTGYGIAGPMLEVEALFVEPTERGRPGIGIHVGAISPLGHGSFDPPGLSGFGGLRLTQPLFADRLRLHGNFGISNGGEGSGIVRGQHVSSWLFGGASLEARFSDRVEGSLEFFHRDPYVPYARWAAVHWGLALRVRENAALVAGLGVSLPYAGEDSRARVFGTFGVNLTTPVRW